MSVINLIKTFSLLAILTGVLLGIGFFFGGPGGAFIALIFAGITNFISYWYSDKIILKMYNAEELTEVQAPTIHQIVGKLSKRADIADPKIYLIKTDRPNAMATGRSPKHSAVAVTSGLLEHLGTDEIEGVLSHEISHIKNRDTLISTVSATIAGAITWIAQILSMMLLFGEDRGNMGGGIFMIFFAPLAAMLVRTAISRNREFLADESGAKISENPEGLMSALKKIHAIAEKNPLNIDPSTSHLFIANPLSKNSITSLFSTHPPLEARIEKLSNLKL